MVQANIRYIAFEDGIAGYKPANAQMCTRKSMAIARVWPIFTKEMLTALGFDARLCWLGTNHIAIQLLYTFYCSG
jgi:hypothetical protein